MEINRISGDAIIIAGNGMCTGGRIVHHLKNQLWRSKTHMIIVGFQAHGTTGRAIVDGAETVSILGNEIAVKAQIHTLGGFSAHADQSQLLTWAKNFKQPRPELYLIHGDWKKTWHCKSSSIKISTAMPTYPAMVKKLLSKPQQDTRKTLQQVSTYSAI